MNRRLRMLAHIRTPFLLTFAITLGVLAASGVLAWTGPSASAPSGNAPAPLNASNAGQIKVGGLQLNTGGAATGLIVGGATQHNGTTTVSGGSINGSFGILPNYVPWNTYGTGAGGAAIYNDSGTYKTLMIVGNNSAGGVRNVGIWDNLNVNGAITSNNVAVCLQNGTGCPQGTGGTITGSGTANYLSKFTTGTALGNSLIYDNGTNVGIGTASPGAKLDINGVAFVGGGSANIGGSAPIANFANSAKLALAWNRTGGQGEADFFQNRYGAVGTGGFNFYDYGNDNSQNLLLGINSNGVVSVPGSLTVGGISIVNGNITGLPGGAGIGNVGVGWYSDSTNFAVRMPGTSGALYIQGPGGSATGGNLNVWGALTVNGTATVGGSTVCTSANGACAAAAPSWASITGKPIGLANMPDTSQAASSAWSLAWKNYANHMIVDMSNSTAPDGSSHSNTNAENAWSPSYPTLMGWNGGGTFGVRVDSARLADSASAVTFNGGLTTASSPTFAGLYSNGAIYVGSGILNTNGDIYLSYKSQWLSTALGWNGTNYSPTFGTVTASAFYYSSDERLKKNIEAIATSTALQKILALQPVTYNWIDASRGTGNQLGFIAQQVEKVVPEIVTTDASTSLKAVDYARVTPLLVGAAQEQQGMIQTLQTQVETQQKQIDALVAEVAALKANK